MLYCPPICSNTTLQHILISTYHLHEPYDFLPSRLSAIHFSFCIITYLHLVVFDITPVTAVTSTGFMFKDHPKLCILFISPFFFYISSFQRATTSICLSLYIHILSLLPSISLFNPWQFFTCHVCCLSSLVLPLL